MKRFLYLSIHRLYLIWILCKIYAEKVQQELFWVRFLGYPYHSNSTKIHLDAALMMYVSLDLECNRQNFLSFWTIFLHFYPPNYQKIQNFEKLKKTSWDIIILHKHTKNYDQVMYGSWDMVCDRCNCYFSFWAAFCPFTHLTAQKIKI